MYRQVLDPLGALGLSALVAAVPLLTIFVLLGLFRTRAHVAGLAGLAVALVVAALVYRMPYDQAALAAVEGAAFGVFPIMWIVINAIWIHQLTFPRGHFHDLRRAFGLVSTDPRVQVLVIAFCFGALLEALAGFGAPVAITASMLTALGLSPLRTAGAALLANTAPVAFGAIAVPIITAGKLTGIPADTIGAMVGRQTPILALVVPFLLVALVDGRRGLRQTWPAAAVCGITFALAQFACSNFLSIELTDIVAALVSLLAVAALLRAWQPRGTEEARSSVLVEAAGGGPGAAVSTRVSPGRVLTAISPYLIIVAVFATAQVPAVAHALDAVTKKFTWPGLHVVSSAGKPVSAATFTFNWLATPGTLLVISGLVATVVLRVGWRTSLHEWWLTVRKLRMAILTVATVLALAYVMNLSGETTTIGTFVAGTGGLLAFLSPLLGWFGTAVTGSDTSSNALFASLQVAAGAKAGINPTLLVAANSSGGVLGKMISPQNLAIAAVAVNKEGEEGRLFRAAIRYSVPLVLALCLLVALQSLPVLDWMLP
ncbi:L-lactate permease [Gandjariella thermophila]|uniref:L-lactate permease n=2 Tax=Gandjariella thermophila TaxID=1931992 RepID=A0A4D4JD44_9PSEU|nr:L-lactate permease [Gandjariella thermophila]